jgi:hypothetical protein
MTITSKTTNTGDATLIPDPTPLPTFKTTDFGTAQYLIHNGHRPKCHLDPADRVVVFVFNDSDELRQQVVAFRSGALVAAIAYAEAGRTIRRLVKNCRYSALAAQAGNVAPTRR